MKKNFATAAAAMLLAVCAGAQTINPTVEVTSNYTSGIPAVTKPMQEFAVPDSVRTFNLDFDYSVFDNPYKGSYEFKPYMVRLRPAPTDYPSGKLHFRAGAGYRLHPEADLAWNVVSGESTKVNVTASHRSYFGPYSGLGLSTAESSLTTFIESDGTSFSGYDAQTAAGVDLTHAWKKGLLEVALDADNILASDGAVSRAKTGGGLSLKVKTYPGRGIFRGAAVDYRFDRDAMAGAVAQMFQDVSASVTGGFRVKKGSALLTLGGRFVFSHLEGTYAVNPYVVPRYVIDRGNLHADLGVRVSYILHNDESGAPLSSGLVFPAVDIQYGVPVANLAVYAKATGGDRLTTLPGLVDMDHFLPGFSCSLFNTIERVNASAGVKGRISGRFGYDLSGGFIHVAESPLFEYVSPFAATLPGIVLCTYDLAYARAAYSWNSASVSIDGDLSYVWNDVPAEGGFAPAALSGRTRIAYTWGGRLEVGAEAGYSTSRSAVVHNTRYSIPGYVDLGAFARFGITSFLDVWARGGNLLGSTIQKVPFHAPQGAFFTGGIALNL